MTDVLVIGKNTTFEFLKGEGMENVRRSTEVNDLVQALAKIQATMEGAKKVRDNPFHKSKYADLSDVWDVLRKPLADNGIVVVQAPYPAGDGKVGIETTLIHTSGQFWTSRIDMPLVKNDPQAVGSAITYARRYALSAMVGLCQEDDDGETAMGRGTQEKAEEKKKAQPKKPEKRAETPPPPPDPPKPEPQQERQQKSLDPQKELATAQMVKEFRTWMEKKKIPENPFMQYLSEIQEINGWKLSRRFIEPAENGVLSWNKTGKGLYSYWKANEATILAGYKQWASEKGIAAVSDVFEGSKTVKQPPAQNEIQFPEGPKDAEE